MKKMKKIYMFLVIGLLLLIEAVIVSKLYVKGAFFDFRSSFWLAHEVAVLVFLAVFYFLLDEEIGYFDIFLILFPLGGAVLLFAEKMMFFWKIPQEYMEEALSVEKREKVKKRKESLSAEDFNVMSFYDLFSSESEEKKKKFLFSYDPEDISEKVKILKRGLLDENIDVIHYAATELNKVDTEIQKKINISEKSGKEGENSRETYRLYKEYVKSGLLSDAILDFYRKKLFSLMENIDFTEEEKECEKIDLCRHITCEEYGSLLKRRAAVSPNPEIISEYLKYLYGEGRYKEVLSEYKKYSENYEEIRIPEFLREYA